MSDLVEIAVELEGLAQKLRTMELGEERPGGVLPGHLLARARNQANLSQSKLSELSGVSTNAIIKFETGKTVPRERTLMALAEHVDIPWQWLKEDEHGDVPVTDEE